jgi:hypothetical protein
MDRQKATNTKSQIFKSEFASTRKNIEFAKLISIAILLFLYNNFPNFLDKFPRVILFVVWFYFGIQLMTNTNTDTTSITNSAFVLLGSLAGLCFSFSSAIAFEKKESDLIAFAGERFLHSGIIVLFCTLLKYVSLSLLTKTMLSTNIINQTMLHKFPLKPIASLLSFSGVGLFVFTFLQVDIALEVINGVLFERMVRYGRS